MARARSSTAETVRPRLLILAGLLVAFALPQPAEAGYRLCNRTAYVLDAALAIETGGATATQGWFRILPGACETVLAGSAEGSRFFLHTRTPDIYGERPEATEVSRMFCVQPDDFLQPGAQSCAAGRGQLAPFTEVTGDFAGTDATSALTDGSGRSLDEARRAGLHRLLALAGYPPGTPEGGNSEQARAALDLFRADRRIAPDAGDARLFAALLEAAGAAARATGLTLCNASPHRVLAAYGIAGGDGVVTRGWYDLAAGACTQVSRRPLDTGRLYVHGAAVDAGGRPIIADGEPLIWAGEERLCTGSLRFEIAEHGACPARGLDATGFRPVATGGAKGWTVRIGMDWPGAR